MEEFKTEKELVLLTGNHKSIYGLAVCLHQAGHPVQLKTQDCPLAEKRIGTHYTEIVKQRQQVSTVVNSLRNGKPEKDLQIVSDWNISSKPGLSFVLTEEQVGQKHEAIRQLEEILPSEAAIGVNTESIPLCEIQTASKNPRRVLGMNWVEPVYNTYFLEIIGNNQTDQELVRSLHQLARQHWNKDPYIINGELGIRMPLIGALVREAFFLIENGYATVEDIDRACRNDAGYYLPFAGNLRYMDLMGTSAYGMVMKDLNPELGTDTELPQSFLNLVNRGNTGVDSGQGFYYYPDDEAEKWENLLQEFSFEIKELFNQYPFKSHPEAPPLTDKTKQA